MAFVSSTGLFHQVVTVFHGARCAQSFQREVALQHNHVMKPFAVRPYIAQPSPRVIRMSGEKGGPPINAPSSVLLLTSSVLAIASIGCVFELSSGHPTYGQTLTSAILTGSFPGFIFFFYAAVRKGQQEAMDDP